MSSVAWDGVERRAAQLAVEQSKPNRTTVEVPMVMVIVGFATVLLLQVVSLFHHFFLSGDHIVQKKADASFICYIVKSSQGQAPSVDLLTDCGFIPRIKGVAD